MTESFDEVDNDIKLAMAKEPSPLKLGLCVLTLAQEMLGRERMSADEIVEALDTLGVYVKRSSLVNAFNRSSAKMRATTHDGVIKYRAMTLGCQEVEDILQISGPEVIHVQSGEHHTAREHLREMLANLEGVVRICDPYYGVRSLGVLGMIPSDCDVRFLTGRTSEPSATISTAVGSFQSEYPHVEIRKYPTPSDLHDRYLIESDHFWILGHGIKDIGNKESFIVRIKSDHARDLIADLTATFDDRWSNSSAP